MRDNYAPRQRTGVARVLYICGFKYEPRLVSEDSRIDYGCKNQVQMTRGEEVLADADDQNRLS